MDPDQTFELLEALMEDLEQAENPHASGDRPVRRIVWEETRAWAVKRIAVAGMDWLSGSRVSS